MGRPPLPCRAPGASVIVRGPVSPERARLLARTDIDHVLRAYCDRMAAQGFACDCSYDPGLRATGRTGTTIAADLSPSQKAPIIMAETGKIPDNIMKNLSDYMSTILTDDQRADINKILNG